MSLLNNLFGAGPEGTGIGQATREDNYYDPADSPGRKPAPPLQNELPAYDENRQFDPVQVVAAKPLAVELLLPALVRQLRPDRVVISNMVPGTTSRQILGEDGARHRVTLQNNDGDGDIYLQTQENGAVFTLEAGESKVFETSAAWWGYSENGTETLEIVTESFDRPYLTDEV